MKSKKKTGSIILLGSIYGVVGQDVEIYKNTKIRENITYSVIKGGIVNFTKQMASYYGSYDIRVNSLCAGGLEGHVAGKSKKQDNIFVENYIQIDMSYNINLYRCKHYCLL